MSGVPPLVLIAGPEQVLADRALAQTVAALREGTPDLEVIRLQAGTYAPGQWAIEASPSLFGGEKVIVLADLDEATDEAQLDTLDYLAAPQPDVTLIGIHRGGQKAKKVLDTFKKSGARVIDAPAIKSDRDKVDFAMNEFRAGRRKATREAVQALVDAVGSDVSELASACQQLIADTQGTIDESVVARYHGGKVEATGFKVADAALAGRTSDALALLRHAVAVGVDPVPIVANLAAQVRQLIRVGAAGRGGRSADLARELGMAPWQVDKARRTLGGWDGESLGRVHRALAAADFEIKGGNREGGGRDPHFVLERTLLRVCGEHANNR